MDDEGVEPSFLGQLVFKWTCAIWGKRGTTSAEDTRNGHERWPDPESIAYALLVVISGTIQYANHQNVIHVLELYLGCY